MLVVGSYRDTDVGPDHPLWHLLAEPGSSGETLTLSGLGTDDVAALLADARGAGGAGSRQAVDGAASIRDHTGGNPFFVLNVARLLEAEGHDLTSGRPFPLPAGVRAVLDRRLARLSQPCHELLGTAAVIGHRFDVALLTEVSGIQADVVAGLLEESARSRLTQPVGGTGHEFAHALVRATLTAQLATRQREALHGRVADALTGRRGEEDVRWAAIAHHELSAGADHAATRGVLSARARRPARDGGARLRSGRRAARAGRRRAVPSPSRRRTCCSVWATRTCTAVTGRPQATPSLGPPTSLATSAAPTSWPWPRWASGPTPAASRYGSGTTASSACSRRR